MQASPGARRWAWLKWNSHCDMCPQKGQRGGGASAGGTSEDGLPHLSTGPRYGRRGSRRHGSGQGGKMDPDPYRIR